MKVNYADADKALELLLKYEGLHIQADDCEFKDYGLPNDYVTYLFDYIAEELPLLIELTPYKVKMISVRDGKENEVRQFLKNGGFTRISKKKRIQNLGSNVFKWLPNILAAVALAVSAYGLKDPAELKEQSARLQALEQRLSDFESKSARRADSLLTNHLHAADTSFRPLRKKQR